MNRKEFEQYMAHANSMRAKVLQNNDEKGTDGMWDKSLEIAEIFDYDITRDEKIERVYNLLKYNT